MAKEIGSGFAVKLKYEQLMEYTDNFNEENFLGTFQFGKVYRGKIERGGYPTRLVMVKMWEVPEIYHYLPGDNEARVVLEVILLQHERLKSHPGMIELYGYCWGKEHLGAVYNFNPLDTVHNLVPKDSFTWLQRIKVAVGIAHLLKFLHTGNSTYKQFLVRNVSAAHVVVDEEYNPKLFDFGMISGGIFPDRTTHKAYYLLGCYGYIDPYGAQSGEWSVKQDVYAYGSLLISLITKIVYTEEERRSDRPPICDQALDMYYGYSDSKEEDCGIKKRVPSVVHESFTMDPDFSTSDGRKITKLAMKCIFMHAEERPTTKEVIKCLMKLEVVKKHAKYLGLAGVDG